MVRVATAPAVRRRRARGERRECGYSRVFATGCSTLRALGPGATLLDVGCGDGLDRLRRARPRSAPEGRVHLLGHLAAAARPRASARQRDGRGRSVLVRLRAGRRPARIEDASVDAVTTRSVLIYVADKAGGVRRVSSGAAGRAGALSIWEPINRFNATYEPDDSAGRLPDDVRELAKRLGDRLPRIAAARLRPDDGL